jgi:HicA toxin of bacterial toxin-antitoxin,
MATVDREGERIEAMAKEARLYAGGGVRRHTRIVLGSKVSRMPRHPAKEIKTGTLRSILKDLGLKM